MLTANVNAYCCTNFLRPNNNVCNQLKHYYLFTNTAILYVETCIYIPLNDDQAWRIIGKNCVNVLLWVHNVSNNWDGVESYYFIVVIFFFFIHRLVTVFISNNTNYMNNIRLTKVCSCVSLNRYAFLVCFIIFCYFV